jgi:hypothetical protein
MVGVFALFASMLVAGGVPADPAGAAAPPRNGATAESAAPSCWSIKQSYPASTDGIYWLWTPTLVAPQQFYCDMTTQGGGWVLIGRGREGWGFGYEGQGNPADVRNPITGPDAFAPKALSTKTVDGLVDGGRMDALVDGIRVRRATNTTGTTWQEVRMRVKTFGRWSWAFSGGIYLSSITFDGSVTSLGSSTYRTNTTANTQVDNQFRRVNTVPNSNKSYRAGFSYGGNVTNGTNSATSYLWEFQNENNATPFAQVFIRPRITEADIVAQGVSYAPDGGLPAKTLRPMLDPRPTAQPWGVVGRNDGTAIPSLRANVLAFAEIGNTIYVGGKFLQVQNGPNGPAFNQAYVAAFDRDTGEWIPGFAPAVNGPVWEMKAAPDGSKLFVGASSPTSTAWRTPSRSPRSTRPPARRWRAGSAPPGGRAPSRTSAPWTCRAPGSTSAATSPASQAAWATSSTRPSPSAGSPGSGSPTGGPTAPGSRRSTPRRWTSTRTTAAPGSTRSA